MNGEEEQRVHEHVRAESVSLRDYFESLFREREKAVVTALAAAEKAVLVAQNAQERVNEKQNEFRQTLVDQNATFMPRETFEAAMKEVSRRLEMIEAEDRVGAGRSQGTTQAALESEQTRRTFLAVGGLFLTGVFIAVTIVGIVLATR